MSKLDHAASLISSDAASTQKATLQQRITNRKSINTGDNVLFLRRKVARPLKPAGRMQCYSAVRVFFADLQEWSVIPPRFDPYRSLTPPRFLKARTASDSRGRNIATRCHFEISLPAVTRKKATDRHMHATQAPEVVCFPRRRTRYATAPLCTRTEYLLLQRSVLCMRIGSCPDVVTAP